MVVGNSNFDGKWMNQNFLIKFAKILIERLRELREDNENFN